MTNLTSVTKILSDLNEESELIAFLQDLCTPKELKTMHERWKVCQLLAQGISYREIHKRSGASLATISRVARFLNSPGYKKALSNINL